MQPTDFENLTRQAKLHLAEIERLTHERDQAREECETAHAHADACREELIVSQTKLQALIAAAEELCDWVSEAREFMPCADDPQDDGYAVAHHLRESENVLRAAVAAAKDTTK